MHRLKERLEHSWSGNAASTVTRQWYMINLFISVTLSYLAVEGSHVTWLQLTLVVGPLIWEF